jgi:hypothetical protein
MYVHSVEFFFAILLPAIFSVILSSVRAQRMHVFHSCTCILLAPKCGSPNSGNSKQILEIEK